MRTGIAEGQGGADDANGSRDLPLERQAGDCGKSLTKIEGVGGEEDDDGITRGEMGGMG